MMGWSEEDRRREETERGMKEYSKFINLSNNVHFVGPEAPEECLHLTALTLRSSLFVLLGPIYRYIDELLADDGRAKYIEYLDLLKLLQARLPEQSLLLKAPEHTPHLRQIVDTIPGVAVVHTHRDPVLSSVSWMSLTHAYYSNMVKSLDVRRMADMIISSRDSFLTKNLEARQTHGDAVFDVFYNDLMSDPVAVVRRIYERFNIQWPTGHEDRILAYLSQNPRGKHGQHRYSAYEFGIEETEITRGLSDYYEYFGLGPRQQAT
jgi:hypothetical protein